MKLLIDMDKSEINLAAFNVRSSTSNFVAIYGTVHAVGKYLCIWRSVYIYMRAEVEVMLQHWTWINMPWSPVTLTKFHCSLGSRSGVFRCVLQHEDWSANICKTSERRRSLHDVIVNWGISWWFCTYLCFKCPHIEESFVWYKLEEKVIKPLLYKHSKPDKTAAV